MKKNFVERIDCGEYAEERVYTVQECTAIAATAGDTERQDALLVTRADEEYGSEKFEQIVFGWTMPEDDEGFAAMCEDYGAWSSDDEAIETVILPGEEDNPRAYRAEKTYFYRVTVRTWIPGSGWECGEDTIAEETASIESQEQLDRAIKAVEATSAEQYFLLDEIVPAAEELCDGEEKDVQWAIYLMARKPGDNGEEIASAEFWESAARAASGVDEE